MGDHASTMLKHHDAEMIHISGTTNSTGNVGIAHHVVKESN